MDIQRLQETLDRYDQHLRAHQPVRDMARPKCYLRWMVGRATEFLRDAADSLDDARRLELLEKASRWLGFIQGVLWATGEFTIDELREHENDVAAV